LVKHSYSKIKIVKLSDVKDINILILFDKKDLNLIQDYQIKNLIYK